MNERIKELRLSLKLSQEAFGARIGVTRALICKLETGGSNITNQMFLSICREFNVNEEWLRTGNGQMYITLSRSERVAHIVAQGLRDENKTMQNIFIALGELSPDEWALIEKIINKLKEE